MIKTFCDVCKGELTHNMVDERLIVDAGHFRAEVIITKDGLANDGDLCYDCLMKMLITAPPQPRKPRSDKGTKRIGKRLEPEPITVITPELKEMEEGLNSEGFTLLKPTKKKTRGKPDISTFSIQTLYPDGEDGQPTRLSMGEIAIVTQNLKAGTKELLGLNGLDEADVEEAPESEGKSLLMGILK